MAKTIKSFLFALLTVWLEDILILSGVTLAVVNTYLLSALHTSTLAGNYTLAGVLILVGIVLAKRG